jgi:hypothetical protein
LDDLQLKQPRSQQAEQQAEHGEQPREPALLGPD